MDFKVIFRDTFLEDLERLVKSVGAHNPDRGAIIPILRSKGDSQVPGRRASP